MNRVLRLSPVKAGARDAPTDPHSWMVPPHFPLPQCLRCLILSSAASPYHVNPGLEKPRFFGKKFLGF